ncbi:hypothetical protein HPB49_015117 [Dermacentor silvarum]|uniref:Uncharacterized protein n=1 Tax=Dermacentor silvarum TaxID=543639 RepID=A0ACB8CA04_DERSI|nr:hypothetical protein HPB49_015117 [Dermacentor silvarum]
MSNKYDEAMAKLKHQSDDISDLKKRVVKLEAVAKEKEVDKLKHEINELDQYSRRLNLEVHGLSQHTNENLLEKLNKLASDLELPPLSECDVEAAHRIPSKNEKTNDKTDIVKVRLACLPFPFVLCPCISLSLLFLKGTISRCNGPRPRFQRRGVVASPGNRAGGGGGQGAQFLGRGGGVVVMAYRGPAYGLSAQIASKVRRNSPKRKLRSLQFAVGCFSWLGEERDAAPPIPQVLSSRFVRADDPSENSFLARRLRALVYAAREDNKARPCCRLRTADNIASKRDTELESQILDWIEEVLEQRLPQGPYEEVLRDGVVLCKLMNALNPGSIPKINTTGGQFKKMENIVMFQNAAKEWGVPEIDVFQTVDLWERRNIPQVSQCILALGRACYLHPEYQGPCLGPKPAEENKRHFSEQQLRAGEGIINLQYGTNKGANASGINFGNTRHM